MDKYKKLLKSVLGHELISGTFYLFLGTTISSLLAFILNLFLVRNISYADYGVFSAMISLILLLTIPAQSMTAIIVRYAAKFITDGEMDRAGAFYLKLLKYLLAFSAFVIIGFVIFSPLIARFLKIDDLSVIIISGITVAAMYIATLNLAFLQSMLLFKKLGFITVLSGIAKLVTGVVLVYAGFRAFGALFANLMFPIINYFSGLVVLKKVISSGKGKSANIPVNEFLKYAFPTAIAIISLSSFISSDVILVKHYFSPDDAGLYGGLSLIGRVIFYFTGPIPLVMFPLVVKRYTKGENYKSLLYLSLMLVLLPSIFISIFYFVYPEFIINIFLGGRAYLTIAPLVGLFGIFLTLYSLNNVLISFFLSIRKTIVSIIVLFFALIQILLIFIYHESFGQILTVSIFSSILLMISLVLYYLIINNKKGFISS